MKSLALFALSNKLLRLKAKFRGNENALQFYGIVIKEKERN